MDDDDDFLYGTSEPAAEPQQTIPEKQPQSALVAHLEAKAEAEASNEEPEDEGEPVEEEDSDDDIEFIMDPSQRPKHSIDFRQNAPLQRQASLTKAPSAAPSSASKSQQTPTLTTEYHIIQRNASAQGVIDAKPPAQDQAVAMQQLQPSTSAAVLSQSDSLPGLGASQPDDGIDTSTLPAVTAPPSHPSIDPDATGFMEGRSILEVDLGTMADKHWRKPGSDISDWFNYGFDEISWEQYCYRRRDVGDLANVLKTSVLSFSGMPEDQLTQLPNEVRQMVMTGTSAMMNNAGMNGGNPMMMDMGMMNPMGMGMNPEMNIGGSMIDGRGMMMGADGSGGQGIPQSQNGPTPTVEQGMMMQDAQNGMMNMGGEFPMQDTSSQMYQGGVGIEGSPPNSTSGQTLQGRAMMPNQNFRGRGVPTMPRGRGAFQRGRGRGVYNGDERPTPPARPISPLPANVPTGPRSQSKYKDRDGGGPAVDGLDYGGGRDVNRSPSRGPDDRSSRKRRSSPPDDGRSSKRR